MAWRRCRVLAGLVARRDDGRPGFRSRRGFRDRPGCGDRPGFPDRGGCRAAAIGYPNPGTVTGDVRVGRSARPTGPYVDESGTPMTAGGGTQILASHGHVIGPGGQSVMHDAGGDLLVYHYYAANAHGTPELGINLLGWDSAGWPYVM